MQIPTQELTVLEGMAVTQSQWQNSLALGKMWVVWRPWGHLLLPQPASWKWVQLALSLSSFPQHPWLPGEAHMPTWHTWPFWSAPGHLLASAPSLILETPTQPLPLSLLRPSSSPVLQQPCLTLVRSQLSVVPHPAGDTVTSSRYIRCHSGPSWVHNFCPGPTLAEHWLALGMSL